MHCVPPTTLLEKRGCSTTTGRDSIRNAVDVSSGNGQPSPESIRFREPFLLRRGKVLKPAVADSSTGRRSPSAFFSHVPIQKENRHPQCQLTLSGVAVEKLTFRLKQPKFGG
jgi:hypothetical protein